MTSNLSFNSWLTISKDANGERIVEASRNIFKGTLLFCSYPLVISPNSNCLNNVCNYCYRQFTSLYRCSKCRLVRYCSKECQKADWRMHRLECPYLLKLVEMEEKHSTGNLLIEMLMIRLLHAIASNGVTQDFSSLPLAESRSSYLFKSSISDLHAILKRQYVPSPSVKSECDLVCSYMQYLLNMIGDNSLPTDLPTLSSCYYLLKQNLIDVICFHKSIAKGVYFPLPCILTYDIPNTICYFEDNLLYVVASTDIEKGSFISFSYIPYYLPSPLKQTLYDDRCLSLHSLSNQTSFNQLMTMKCPNGHEQPVDYDNIKKSNKKEMICSICEATFTIPFLIKKKDGFKYSLSLDLYDMNRDNNIPLTMISQMYEKTYGEDNYILYLLYKKIRDQYISNHCYQDALPFCYKVIHYEEKYLLDQQYSLLNDYLTLLITLSKLSLWDDAYLISDKIQDLIINSFCVSDKEIQYIKQYLIQVQRCGDVSSCMS